MYSHTGDAQDLGIYKENSMKGSRFLQVQSKPGTCFWHLKLRKFSPLVCLPLAGLFGTPLIWYTTNPASAVEKSTRSKKGGMDRRPPARQDSGQWMKGTGKVPSSTSRGPSESEPGDTQYRRSGEHNETRCRGVAGGQRL